MPQRFPKETRELAGALCMEGLGVPEITRRFNAGEAGLAHAIEISERRVRELVRDYEAEHGPPPDPEDADLTADSLGRVMRRALAVLAREVRHLETLKPGKVTVTQSKALRQHYATLDDMQRRTELAEQRRSKKGRRGKGQSGKADGPESAIERLAKAQREAVAKPEGPPIDSIPNQGTAGDRARSEAGTANARENGATQGTEPISGPLKPGTTAGQAIADEERDGQNGSKQGSNGGQSEGQSMPKPRTIGPPLSPGPRHGSSDASSVAST